MARTWSRLDRCRHRTNHSHLRILRRTFFTLEHLDLEAIEANGTLNTVSPRERLLAILRPDVAHEFLPTQPQEN